MHRIALLLAALFFALGSPASLLPAVDWFVSGTGSDGNGGSSSGDAFRTITKALSMASSGDRVVVGAGTYDGAAGETFPLALGDGVAVEGPGNGTAVVNRTTTGPVFTIGNLTAPASIAGLTITATGISGVCVSVTGTPAEISLLDCELSGRYGLANGTSLGAILGGKSKVLLDGNTIQTGEIGFLWSVHDVTGTHEITITNNSMTGGRWGVVLYGFTSSTGLVRADALIASNVVTGATSGGIGIFDLKAGSGSAAQIDAEVRNNLVTSGGKALLIQVLASGTSASAGLDLTAVSNTFQSCTAGIVVAQLAPGSSAYAGLLGTLSCNQVDNCMGGLLMQANAGLGGSVVFQPAVRYNAFSQCITGVGYLALASSAAAHLDAGLTGNTITGNAGDGLLISASTAGTVQLDLPVLGGATIPAWGRNTFSGNATASPSMFDLRLSVSTSQTVAAGGNWWAASSSTGIEPTVWDQADSSALADLDYAPPLASSLVFTAVPAGPGQPAAVLAGNGTAFVPKAGATPIVVTVDGVPALDPVVAADGRSLVFTVPAGVLLGPRSLVITNPGGQTGAFLMMIAIQGGSGNCFVATAAFEDAEAPEVRLLRRWRDDCLAGNPLGRQLVQAYYALSPPLARAVAERPLARSLSRAALTPVVGAVRLWMEAPWLLAAGAAWWLWRLLRRRD